MQDDEADDWHPADEMQGDLSYAEARILERARRKGGANE